MTEVYKATLTCRKERNHSGLSNRVDQLFNAYPWGSHSVADYDGRKFCMILTNPQTDPCGRMDGWEFQLPEPVFEISAACYVSLYVNGTVYVFNHDLSFRTANNVQISSLNLSRYPSYTDIGYKYLQSSGWSSILNAEADANMVNKWHHFKIHTVIDPDTGESTTDYYWKKASAGSFYSATSITSVTDSDKEGISKIVGTNGWWNRATTHRWSSLSINGRENLEYGYEPDIDDLATIENAWDLNRKINKIQTPRSVAGVNGTEITKIAGIEK
jgi:hypothetical protein